MMKIFLVLTIAVGQQLSLAEDAIIKRYEFADLAVEVSGSNKILAERDLVLPLIVPDPVTGEHIESDESVVMNTTEMVSTRTISVVSKSGDKQVLKSLKSEPYTVMALPSGGTIDWAASVLDVQLFGNAIHVLYIENGHVRRESFLKNEAYARLYSPYTVMEFQQHRIMVKSIKFDGGPSKLSIEMLKGIEVREARD